MISVYAPGLTVEVIDNVIAPTPPAAAPILQDDFESGNFDKWVLFSVFQPFVSIVQSPTDPSIVEIPRPGKALKIHYEIPASGEAHQDDNAMLYYELAKPVDHLFARGFVLIPKNTQLYGATTGIQRKLMYFKSDSPAGTETLAFWFMLTADMDTREQDYIDLRFAYNAGYGASLWDVGKIYKGKWTEVQVEAKLNPPGVANGVLRLWLNKEMVYENTAVDLRGPISSDPSFKFGRFELGRQVDRYHNDPVSEDRYWDDVRLSSTFI